MHALGSSLLIALVAAFCGPVAGVGLYIISAEFAPTQTPDRMPDAASGLAYTLIAEWTPTIEWNVSDQPTRGAGYVATLPAVEIEGDGMQAQVPPPRLRQDSDDPVEAFSPNYGTKPPSTCNGSTRIARTDAVTDIF